MTNSLKSLSLSIYFCKCQPFFLKLCYTAFYQNKADIILYMKQIAIIGPTASGKSDLALELAQQTNAYILSLDSLSIYKEIDIASAKPSKQDLKKIKHFGIDEIYPNDTFNAYTFAKIYQQALNQTKILNKNLIIVGGSSFYLSSMLNGLSPLPTITKQVQQDVDKMLLYVNDCYELLQHIDPKYMQNIKPNDKYRIQKMLLIYKASSYTPSQWFSMHPPHPVIKELPIYNIAVQKDDLIQRIHDRTNMMITKGLIDEVAALEQKYFRSYGSMKAIGIIETLQYLDGLLTKEQLAQEINLHTRQLAKRQQVFNKTQFKNSVTASLKQLRQLLFTKD